MSDACVHTLEARLDRAMSEVRQLTADNEKLKRDNRDLDRLWDSSSELILLLVSALNRVDAILANSGYREDSDIRQIIKQATKVSV